MKICVITPRWAIAGVPLAQRRFAIALANAGHDVDLIVGRKDADLTIPPSDAINLIVWEAGGVRAMLRPIMRYLRRAKPDVVFSAEDHLNGVVLLAAILSRSTARISGSSRVPPSDTYSNQPFTKRWVFKQLMRSVMWRANALTCVSRDMVTNYRTYFPDGPHTAVYNIIDDAASRARIAEAVDHPWFTARDVPVVASAGTLTGRKNFKLAVAAVALLKERGRHVRLAIFGEGYRRPELEQQIADEGLDDRVWLPGRVANPLAYFARADVSVLSSWAEGLPNVLVESMMCGCTPVATDCPTGPRELLHDGAGYLVPMGDAQAMADALEQALDRPIARETLDEAIRPFKESSVIDRHFEVLGLSGRG